MRIRLLLIITGVFFQTFLNGQDNFNIKRTFNETNHQIICACYSSDGKYIVTAGSDNSIILWNAESGIIYRTLTGLKKRPNTVAMSAGNDRLISGGEDNIITVWNPSTSLPEFTLEGHTDVINSLDISPDGRYLASGSSDKTIRIWDVDKRSLIFELKGHKGEVTTLKFSPDGKTLASGGADKNIMVWNMANGSIIKSRRLHSDYIRKVIFSPDGTLIASCGDDKLINISDAAGLSVKTTLKGHTDWVQSIDFSPDGRQLISGGHDQLIILWDVASGKMLSQSEKQGEKVLSVDFCPVRPDFISAVVRSENLETWALSEASKPMNEPQSEKSFMPPPPVMEREDRQIRAEVSRESKTIDSKSLVATKSLNIDDFMMKEEKAFERIETPAAKVVVNYAPSIQFFDPVPQADRVVYDKNSIYLIGRVTGPDPVNSILINKNLIKLSEAGVFEYNLQLAKGDNPIELIAVSTRGKMVEKSIIIECTSADAANLTDEVPDIYKGKYYALLIGVDDYKSDDIADLDKPVRDAETLYNVLLTQYTFEKENIIFLKNPTQSDIITTLDKLGRDLTTNDNLLIFYAGHGYWDEKGKIGYWFPSDATRNSTVNWFRNSTLRDFIGSIQTKHTMLIADACFSGAIFKTRAAFSETPQGINTLYDLPSRKAMTSGNLLEVPDESVFIKFLVNKLTDNKEKFLPSEILFSSFKTAVMNNSTGVPQYGVIQNVGDEGGDFIFIKR